MHWHTYPTSIFLMQSKMHPKKGNAVPRYYFDLTNGETTLTDEEGVDASNLDEATTEAQIVLKDMQIGNDLIDIDDGWTIVIREKDGKVLRRIPLEASGDEETSH